MRKKCLHDSRANFSSLAEIENYRVQCIPHTCQERPKRMHLHDCIQELSYSRMWSFNKILSFENR